MEVEKSVTGLFQTLHKIEVNLAEQQADTNSPLYSAQTFEELNLCVRGRHARSGSDLNGDLTATGLGRSSRFYRLRPEQLLRGVYAMGFQRPSKIQERALPLLLRNGPSGRSVRHCNLLASLGLSVARWPDVRARRGRTPVQAQQPDRAVAGRHRQDGGVRAVHARTDGRDRAGGPGAVHRPDPRARAADRRRRGADGQVYENLCLHGHQGARRRYVGVFAHRRRGMRARPDDARATRATAPSTSSGPVRDHIVIGTPGTVSDLLAKRRLNLSQLRVFAVDEADDMLDRQVRRRPLRCRNSWPHLTESTLLEALFCRAWATKRPRSVGTLALTALTAPVMRGLRRPIRFNIMGVSDH